MISVTPKRKNLVELAAQREDQERGALRRAAPAVVIDPGWGRGAAALARQGLPQEQTQERLQQRQAPVVYRNPGHHRPIVGQRQYLSDRAAEQQHELIIHNENERQAAQQREEQQRRVFALQQREQEIQEALRLQQQEEDNIEFRRRLLEEQRRQQNARPPYGNPREPWGYDERGGPGRWEGDPSEPPRYTPPPPPVRRRRGSEDTTMHSAGTSRQGDYECGSTYSGHSDDAGSSRWRSFDTPESRVGITSHADGSQVINIYLAPGLWDPDRWHTLRGHQPVPAPDYAGANSDNGDGHNHTHPDPRDAQQPENPEAAGAESRGRITQ